MSNTKNTQASVLTTDVEQSLVTMAKVSYGLQAFSLILGFTIIISVILSYIKRGEAKNSWLKSHFTWQINTFWYGLLWGVVGGITFVFGVGYLILAADAIWIVYRIIKGWLQLSSQQDLYA